MQARALKRALAQQLDTLIKAAHAVGATVEIRLKPVRSRCLAEVGFDGKLWMGVGARPDSHPVQTGKAEV